MSLTPEQVQQWSHELVQARHQRATRSPLTDELTLSLDDAYAIQREVTAARLARGERIVGWKLGYTSLAMREQMGIGQPNFGPLTDAMVLRSDDSVSPSLVQPRVEPEICLRFGLALEGVVTVDDVLAATDEAVACLEVVDSVYTDYRFRLEDNTADGSSAAQVVLGPALPPGPLDEMTVELLHDGDSVARSTGAAASGHPAVGVVWLVEQLAQRGLRIEPGQFVITGGLTKAVPLLPGERISARFAGSVEVGVTR